MENVLVSSSSRFNTLQQLMRKLMPYLSEQWIPDFNYISANLETNSDFKDFEERRINYENDVYFKKDFTFCPKEVIAVAILHYCSKKDLESAISTYLQHL